MTQAPPPAGTTPHAIQLSSPEQCDLSPAAAIYAALTARPGGATTAIIAEAAGIGRRAARDALAAMEIAGAVARTIGGRPGVPDIWTSAIGLSHARTGHQVTDGGGQADGLGPDSAVVAEIAKRIEQILGAASAARIVLADGGNMSAVRARLDEIWEQAAQARRALTAAEAGKKAQAARPGALRDKILGHLRNHPGTDFTPHEIHKVLGNSSGAIGNALDTLVARGQAELACDRPRRFRLASGARAAAEIGSADGTPVGTELAGAA
jgi:hypothetical protein